MYIILSRPRRSGGTGRLLQKAISDIHSRRGQRKRGSERRHKDQENSTGGILYIVRCVPAIVPITCAYSMHFNLSS